MRPTRKEFLKAFEKANKSRQLHGLPALDVKESWRKLKQFIKKVR